MSENGLPPNALLQGQEERMRGKKQPLTAAGVHGLRAEYTRTIEPARALAAESLNLERKSQAKG